MGIKNAYKLFKSTSTIKETSFKGLRIGIDASYEIYRASLGARRVNEITDNKGTPTICLNVFLCNITRMKKIGVKGLLYVFDNPEPNDMKIKEQKKRAERREKYNSNEKARFKLNGECISDVKKLLELMGIPYITAPKNIEAEQLASGISELDLFITADFDALLFGNDKIIKKLSGPGRKYELYDRKKILDDHKITQDDFIKACIALGCDFADKTPRIGIKTVLKKLNDITLTDEQKKAYDYFKKDITVNLNNTIVKKQYDRDGLIKYLVSRNFNKDRVEKILKDYV